MFKPLLLWRAFDSSELALNSIEKAEDFGGIQKELKTFEISL